MDSDIDVKIKKVMSAILNINENEISNNSNSKNISSWDSLAHMNLVIALEEEFNLEFNENQIPLLINYLAIKENLSK